MTFADNLATVSPAMDIQVRAVRGVRAVRAVRAVRTATL